MSMTSEKSKIGLMALIYHFSTIAGFFFGLVTYNKIDFNFDYIFFGTAFFVPAYIALIKIYEALMSRNANRILVNIVPALVIFVFSAYIGTLFHRM